MTAPHGSGARAALTTNIDWPAATFEALKRLEVRQVGYVPDAGHKRLIELCHADAAIRPAVLTTEEEGIGLACGAWLGGERAVLLMQSSGVGNCVNGFAMVKACGLPLLTLITMRGQWGEFNPWQVPMGQTTPDVLRLAGLAVYPVEAAEEVAPTLEAAGHLAFNSRVGAAVLIGQRLIGSKSFSR
jgi:sulfopyruvate decarboxylase alpha subunit